jgi:glycosyltransferase involved in cell wall biosynthesis
MCGTNTGGLPEVIDDGVTGYLVPVNDHISVANKVIELFENPEIMSKMGSLGYQKAINQFTWQKVVDKMIPYIRKAVEEFHNK